MNSRILAAEVANVRRSVCWSTIPAVVPHKRPACLKLHCMWSALHWKACGSRTTPTPTRPVKAQTSRSSTRAAQCA